MGHHRAGGVTVEFLVCGAVAVDQFFDDSAVLIGVPRLQNEGYPRAVYQDRRHTASCHNNATAGSMSMQYNSSVCDRTRCLFLFASRTCFLEPSV